MKRVVAMVALGAALVLAGAGCGGSTSAFGHGLLFLRSGGYGSARIFLWRPGSPPKQIGPKDYNIDDVEWSPDGSSIAFTRSETGGISNFSHFFAIYLMRPDGTKVRQLTPGYDGPMLNDDFPSWSPDGRQIVFTRSFINDYGDDFVIVDVRSGHERRLIRTGSGIPVWGKPGIAYGQWDSAIAIRLLNPATGRSRLLTRRVTRASLAWSPSGVLAALEGLRINHGHRSGNRIVFLSAAGRVLGELPAPVGTTFQCGPVWSPNGKQILVNVKNEAAVWVWTMSTKHWRRWAVPINPKRDCVDGWR